MQAQPQQEHRRLQQLTGEWAFEGETIGPPGQPSQKMKGPNTCGRSVISESSPMARATCPVAARRHG